MTHRSRLIWLAILLALPIVAFTKEPDYTVHELDTVPSLTWGQPFAINARGQIVGVACCHDFGTALPAPYFAVMWDNGSVVELPSAPPPPGRITYAYDINNRGQVVGFAGGSRLRGLLWEEDGTVVELGPFAGCCAFAQRINERGQIVGGSTTAPGEGATAPTTAMLWEKNGTIVNLGVLPGDSSSGAVAINNSGQIVGNSRNSGTARAFLWEKGTMSELPGLEGQQYTGAYDINDRGQVVGYSGPWPVMWENGTLIRLDTLPNVTSGQALAINNNGQVVGFVESALEPPSRLPVLWDNGKAMVLPMLPPPLDFANQYVAIDINDGGTIIGYHSLRPLVWVRNARSGN